jgi:hypothetical protein
MHSSHQSGHVTSVEMFFSSFFAAFLSVEWHFESFEAVVA